MSSVTRINAANGVALLEDSLEPILGGNLATLRVPLLQLRSPKSGCLANRLGK